MDEDILFGVCFVIAIFLLPLGVVTFILTISAAVETRSWQKKKALRSKNSDISDALLTKESVDSDSDSDLEVLDSEDEAEKQDRADAKVEEEADWHLTTKQKFCKELSLNFRGRGKINERARRMKERADRRKLAKDVVKVMRHVERRQARLARRAGRAGRSSAVGAADSLPSYRNVLDSKQ